MTDDPSGPPQIWTEVNILPVSPTNKEALLLDVVDGLIHETLSTHIESWHYFWQQDPIGLDHARLRVLWQSGRDRDCEAILTKHLQEAEASGRLWRWYPGGGGKPGEQYQGEAPGYGGPEMWRITYMDWMTGSELALALVKLDATGGLEETRDFHLQRRVHLHSNRLGMNYFEEGRLYLDLAIGYLEKGLGGPGGAQILAALTQIQEVIKAVSDRPDSA